MELSIAETTLAAISVREMLKKDLPYSDRMVLEGLLGKLVISERGIRIREAMKERGKA